MSVRVKRKDLLDFCILSLLLLEVMIIRWLNLVGAFNRIMLILLLYRYFRGIHRTLRDKSVWLYLIMLLYMTWNFFAHGGASHILLKNIFECATPLLIMLYFWDLMSNKREFLLGFVKGMVWPLNIYILINIPIIFLQLSGWYWLAGFTSSTNTYSVDLISGLLGFNGTPVLALFSSFIIVYNFYYAKNWSVGEYRTMLFIYDAVLLVFFCVLSLFNDNKGFYLILLLCIVVYYLSVKESKVFKKGFFRKLWTMIKRFLPFLIPLVVIIALLYNYTKIGGEIDKIIHEFSNAFKYVNKAQGSSERISMIIYALTSTHWLTGFGVGNYTWTSLYAFGFNHYGQSDVGTFMCLGGVAFIILLSILIILSAKKVYHDIFMPFVFWGMFAVIGIYTQVFTVTSLMVCSMLFIVVCWSGREMMIERTGR